MKYHENPIKSHETIIFPWFSYDFPMGFPILLLVGKHNFTEFLRVRKNAPPPPWGKTRAPRKSGASQMGHGCVYIYIYISCMYIMYVYLYIYIYYTYTSLYIHIDIYNICIFYCASERSGSLNPDGSPRFSPLAMPLGWSPSWATACGREELEPDQGAWYSLCTGHTFFWSGSKDKMHLISRCSFQKLSLQSRSFLKNRPLACADHMT